MYCTNCGNAVNEKDGFCTECGAALNASTTGALDGQDSKARAKNPKAGIAVAAGAVCLVAIIGVGVFLANGQGSGNQTVPSTAAGMAQTSSSASEDKDASASGASSATGGGKKLGGGTDYAGSASSGAQASATSRTDGADVSNDNAGETLTVKAADGTTLSGTVRKDASGYVIADSSTVEYTVEELRAMNLSDAELCIAWNEPFARQGYHFKNPGLQAYFQACSWYTDTGNGSSLTGAAAVNNSRLRQLAEENASSRRWEELATS